MHVQGSARRTCRRTCGQGITPANTTSISLFFKELWSYGVTRATTATFLFFAFFSKLAGPDVAGAVQAVTSIERLGEGLDESATQSPRVWFGYDRVEPARRRLYDLQELMRAVRPGARAVPTASPHGCCDNASPY